MHCTTYTFASLLSTIAFVSIAALSERAHADYAGVEIALHNQWSFEGVDYDVYRLFALIEGEGGVTFWGGLPDKPFSINNIDTEGNPGSGFFRAKNQQSAIAEPDGFAYDFDPEAADNSTFMTIGVGAGWTSEDVGEDFSLTPGFNPDQMLPSWGGVGGMVATPDGPNTFPDENGRVLLAQFTVQQGQHVTGEALVETFIVPGGETTVSQFSFTTIPAPSVLAVLGLAGLVGRRDCRR